MRWEMEDWFVWNQFLHGQCDWQLFPFVVRRHNRSYSTDKGFLRSYFCKLYHHCLFHTWSINNLRLLLLGRSPFLLETVSCIHLRLRDHFRSQLEPLRLHYSVIWCLTSDLLNFVAETYVLKLDIVAYGLDNGNWVCLWNKFVPAGVT